MKRALSITVILLAPFVLAACGTSYDAYRSSDARPGDVDSYSREQDESHSAKRPGAQVIYSSDVQGGSGPGSYGGHSSTVITPREDGVHVDHESSGR